MSPAPTSAKTTAAAAERERADRAEPAAPVHLVVDGALERLEARRHRRPLVLDPLAEAREPLGAAVEHAVDDVRDVVAPTAVSCCGSPAESSRSATSSVRRPPQIFRSVVTGSRLVVAAADEVEERRRELVRAGLAALAEQRRDERGLGVGRRLLLVLAVVARSPLAAEEPEDERDDGERGQDRERGEHERACGAGSSIHVVDALAVALVVRRVVELLLDDLGRARGRPRPASPPST